MTLQNRLQRLEAARPARNAGDDARAKLMKRLDLLITRLRDQRDHSHHPEAAPAENVARAFLRGDGDAARSILMAAGRRT